ncbi:MAG: hypothetical protein Q4C70_04445 [Planctomycetia bacterium]|nr:hypothetical protein [Planctomycetia bacterium]
MRNQRYSFFLLFMTVFSVLNPALSSVVFSTEFPATRPIEEGSDMISAEFLSTPRVTVSKKLAEKAGLQILESSRATLVTDLPTTEEIEKLPAVAEMAYSQLCDFFDVTPDPEWKATVFLMKNNLPFMEAGFIPEILPPFANGFSFNYDCWLYEQPSAYYRQHLMIHEMVHSFCTTNFGGAGPNWYAEGLAELLGMHDFSAEPVQLGFMPPNRQAVPHCGRIREVHDAIQRGEARTFTEALHPKNADFATNAMYYWCWVLAWFLENNPDTHDEFHAMIPMMSENLSTEEFTQKFLISLGKKREQVEKQWLMYIATLDYDYRLAPMLFSATPGVPLQEKNADGRDIQKICATSGWQNTGIHVKKGEKIQIRAKGRFEVFCSPKSETWECDPNGITIDYVNGQPRGILQAVFLPDEEILTPETMNNREVGTFYMPMAIGTRKTLTVPFSGTLLLRLNARPSDIEASSGECLVEITDVSH